MIKSSDQIPREKDKNGDSTHPLILSVNLREFKGNSKEGTSGKKSFYRDFEGRDTCWDNFKFFFKIWASRGYSKNVKLQDGSPFVNIIFQAISGRELDQNKGCPSIL